MDLLKYVSLSQVKMEHDQIEAETAVRVQRFVQSITLYFFHQLQLFRFELSSHLFNYD